MRRDLQVTHPVLTLAWVRFCRPCSSGPSSMSVHHQARKANNDEPQILQPSEFAAVNDKQVISRRSVYCTTIQQRWAVNESRFAHAKMRLGKHGFRA